MPTELSAGRVREIYRFMDAHQDEYSVQLLTSSSTASVTVEINCGEAEPTRYFVCEA